MDFWREICITRASYRGGPWIRDLFGPWNGTSEVSAIWAQKSRVMHISRQKAITSRSIKKTGALVILCTWQEGEFQGPQQSVTLRVYVWREEELERYTDTDIKLGWGGERAVK